MICQLFVVRQTAILVSCLSLQHNLHDKHNALAASVRVCERVWSVFTVFFFFPIAKCVQEELFFCTIALVNISASDGGQVCL